MVEYIEDTHTYVVNGVIVPSVTQLLKYKFKDKYKDIPKYILENKAEYGTKVHKLIEIMNRADNFEPIIEAVKEFDYVVANSLEQYKKMYFANKIEALKQEEIIYNEYLAGRYDLLANVNSTLSLLDIKTTAKLDKEYLSWQLSIYNWLGNLKVNKLYAIWLPKKDLGRLEEIKFKNDNEIKELINEWRKNNENNRKSHDL